MKVTDHGFTERVATPPAPAAASSTSANSRSAANTQQSGTSDDLQLSGFAARLNTSAGTDAQNRAEHVSQVAKAVESGTFQIDSAAVSRAIVSEATQS